MGSRRLGERGRNHPGHPCKGAGPPVPLPPIPHFRLRPHLPQRTTGKLSWLLCVKAGVTNMSPQVHAGDSAGL